MSKNKDKIYQTFSQLGYSGFGLNEAIIYVCDKYNIDVDDICEDEALKKLRHGVLNAKMQLISKIEEKALDGDLRASQYLLENILGISRQISENNYISTFSKSLVDRGTIQERIKNKSEIKGDKDSLQLELNIGPSDKEITNIQVINVERNPSEQEMADHLACQKMFDDIKSKINE